jgi:pimeloyl-[acyl-carrier protein] methyl ester esterase
VKPIVLLVHGWGFDASFWAPMQMFLDGIESVAWDLGYFGAPSYPLLPTDRPVVAVGHSFGLLWLLHKRPVVWRALVSMNGFPRFAGGDDFPAGVPARVLDRMIGRFAEMPDKVYGDFMTRCGVAAPRPQGLDYQALAEGLNALRHWDGRSRMADLGPEDLALAGRNDPIVPADLTEHGFDGMTIRWHDAGHLLPTQAPEWCADHLRRICDSLNRIEPASALPGEE